VKVTDDGPEVPGPARLSDTATVTIRIKDVNEAPTLQDATFSVEEGSAIGTKVGTPLNATDPESSPLEWRIVDGNDDGSFSIDSTGQLKVAATGIDFETTPSRRLRVSVTDNGLPAGKGRLTAFA